MKHLNYITCIDESISSNPYYGSFHQTENNCFLKIKKIEGFAVFTVEPSFQGTDDCPPRHLYGTSHYTGWGEGQGKRRKVNYKTVFLGKWK